MLVFDEKEVVKAYLEGESLLSIARRLHVGRPRVRDVLDKLGVERRTRSEAVSLASVHRRVPEDVRRRREKETKRKYWERKREDINAYRRERRMRPGQREKEAEIRRKNSERNSAYKKEWRRRNSEKVETSKARRRAQKRATVRTITRQEWLAKVESYGNACAYCRKPLANPTKDHVIPLSRGGSHIIENLVPACKLCNMRKWAKIVSPLPPIKEVAA